MAWISGTPVVRGFFGNADVVDMTFTYTRVGNWHEYRAGSHLVDILTAGISHRRAQAPRELVENLDDAALVRHAPLDSLRHQLLELSRGILEISIRGAERSPMAPRDPIPR